MNLTSPVPWCPQPYSNYYKLTAGNLFFYISNPPTNPSPKYHHERGVTRGIIDHSPRLSVRSLQSITLHPAPAPKNWSDPKSQKVFFWKANTRSHTFTAHSPMSCGKRAESVHGVSLKPVLPFLTLMQTPTEECSSSAAEIPYGKYFVLSILMGGRMILDPRHSGSLI